MKNRTIPNEKIDSILGASLDKSHTEVCILVSEAIGYVEHIMLLKQIEQRHEEEGSITKANKIKREKIFNELMEQAKETLTPDSFVALERSVQNTSRYM